MGPIELVPGSHLAGWVAAAGGGEGGGGSSRGRGGGGGGGGDGGGGDGDGALLAIPIPRGAALLYDTRLRIMPCICTVHALGYLQYALYVRCLRYDTRLRHRGGANRARKR